MPAPRDIVLLHRVAQRLHASQAARFGDRLAKLPCLIFVTDPLRTPDPLAAARRLPRGAGIIFRAFGAADAREQGRALAQVARSKGLILLVGADPNLARQIGADGVHLPQRLAHRAAALRTAWPAALITAAAHSRGAASRAARSGVDAVLLSPVFASASRSAGAPLGRGRFAGIAHTAIVPVYALGGWTQKTRRSSSARARWA